MIYDPFDMPFPPNKFREDIKNINEGMIQRQFILPRKLNYLAEEFPKLTWAKAQQLYAQAVQEILNESGEKDILSGKLSYGRGWELAERRFIEKLEQKWPKGAFDF